MHYIKLGCITLLMVGLLSGCKKYLDAKTDKALVEPSSLTDAQSLLDNYTQMNTFYPSIATESDDDHFLLDNDFNALNTTYQDDYTWGKNAFFSNADVSWKFIYNSILYANMALETVAKNNRTAGNAADFDRIRGSALFFRAFSLFYAAEFWSRPYDSTTAAQEPGVPIRLTTDINEAITRPSLEQSYNQVIADLKQAVQLLPVSHEKLFRPSKAAAFGMLARVYLTQARYSDAVNYADSCMALYNTLIDYNTIDANAGTPFRSFNDEVIFHAETLQNASIFSPTSKTDTMLFNSYDTADLRKYVYFYGPPGGYRSFKGSYAGTDYYDIPFCGIATDEECLILAEGYARLGLTNKALTALNTLLFKRWKTGAFVPVTAATAGEALNKILLERRKELIGRGMRWLDLRRLNLETQYAKTLVRKINGVTYTLAPGDVRYTFYIPDIVVQTSGIGQNNR